MDVPNHSLMPVVPDLEAVGATPRAYFRDLGQRIRRLRQERELSQRDFAGALDVSQQTICAFEGGSRRVQLHQVPVLMRIFQVSAEQLLGLQPLPPPPKLEISPRVLRLVENIHRLTEEDRRIITRLVEAMRV